ncbi:XdhC family protein [Rhizobium leguminosarum bv. viciae]|uniref:XdhC family protein n=1 Tax=Rhizobium leguminosarum TaxID=384 RepID=UPI0014417F0E|nr:XdhC family protein [Rhizobium leguminosarum]NKJ94696.1 XdhC family protein [Rhizobium leguminosarum bv. viciae]
MSRVDRLQAPVQALDTDKPEEILDFVLAASAQGKVAIATLVGIEGGAARALGALVAVAEDGRYCGFVSGGCVEAAVAAEALAAMEDGRDRTVVFGRGSPYFDIALPCGGGITIAIHLINDPDVLRTTLDRLRGRTPTALRYCPSRQILSHSSEPAIHAGWEDDVFINVFRPDTRIVIFGHGNEASSVERLAASSGYDVVVGNTRDVKQSQKAIDAFTAVVLLYHDIEPESDVLREVLHSPAFYIGALGSRRTHERRVERLTGLGMQREALDRIKAPIGLFGPTKNSVSLALSILAEVAAIRIEAYGH